VELPIFWENSGEAASGGVGSGSWFYPSNMRSTGGNSQNMGKFQLIIKVICRFGGK